MSGTHTPIHTHAHCSYTQMCARWTNSWRLCVACRLPKPVKRRIKALKKLQNDVIQLESQFYKEVHVLECKYATQYASLFDKVSSLQLHSFFRVETGYNYLRSIWILETERVQYVGFRVTGKRFLFVLLLFESYIFNVHHTFFVLWYRCTCRLLVLKWLVWLNS